MWNVTVTASKLNPVSKLPSVLVFPCKTASRLLLGRISPLVLTSAVEHKNTSSFSFSRTENTDIRQFTQAEPFRTACIVFQRSKARALNVACSVSSLWFLEAYLPTEEQQEALMFAFRFSSFLFAEESLRMELEVIDLPC